MTPLSIIAGINISLQVCRQEKNLFRGGVIYTDPSVGCLPISSVPVTDVSLHLRSLRGSRTAVRWLTDT